MVRVIQTLLAYYIHKKKFVRNIKRQQQKNQSKLGGSVCKHSYKSQEKTPFDTLGSLVLKFKSFNLNANIDFNKTGVPLKRCAHIGVTVKYDNEVSCT